MKIERTPIKDLIILTPKIFMDDRGYFMESYNHKQWFEHLNVNFIQDNESMSSKGVLRGFHFQKPPHAQDKLVRVVSGSVLDIVVDIRKSSPTYGQHFKIILSAENKKQLFIPKGFAHGFLTLEDNSIFNYKCSQYYNGESEGSLLWNDPNLAIDWGISDPLLSEKDTVAEIFATFNSPFS
jgi:dTDP-4-dehydrorhamnose 3,5-epimerase